MALDEIDGGSAEGTRVLSKEHKDALFAIVQNKRRMKLDQEAIKEDTKAVAEKLGIPVGKVNKIIGLIIKEQDEGGAIQEEQDVLDLVGQVV